MPRADLDWAVRRVRMGAFAFSGQVCISVQRLYVHDSVWEPFMERFVAARVGAASWATRSTRPPTWGPWSTRQPRSRAERWVEEAVAEGARVLLGGTRRRSLVPAHRARRRAGLGPGLLGGGLRAARGGRRPSRTSTTALAEVNASRFGLQAGIFTNDLQHAWRAFERLEVGGVIVNDVPTYRVDHMPYGGVKDSGLGREGVRFAIEDMTELRLMVVARPG